MTEAEQSFFDLSKGINTEASLAMWPTGFSVDELNYEILKDGSRRKRRSLNNLNVDTTIQSTGDPPNYFGAEDEVVGAFQWTAVSNDTDINFTLIQTGSTLLVQTNTGDPATDSYIWSQDLTSFAKEGATDADVAGAEIDIAFGNGDAFVVGTQLDPFYISYDVDTEAFSTSIIEIKERDYQGYEDGITNVGTPASLTDSHSYNLYNRGWKSSDIAAYFASKSSYPSKAMMPWLGYRRTTTAGVAEADWTKVFSPDKLVAELFQDVSAPQGHFRISPFIASATSSSVAVSTWSLSAVASGAQTVTITTSSAHGLSPSDSIIWAGNSWSFAYGAIYYDGDGNIIYSFGGTYTNTFNGGYTVLTTPTATTLTISIELDWYWDYFQSWVDQFAALGTVGVAISGGPNYTNDRPETVAFWAGRIFYMGLTDGRWTGRIYFSQVIESEAQYGKCYQDADPTDERISDPIDTDGGVIHHPEIRNIKKAVPYGASLVIFADTGVWQLSPGSSGLFSPLSYSLRKISDQGLVGKRALVLAESLLHYCSYSDIYSLQQDKNQGFLFAQNMSFQQAHALYNSIDGTSGIPRDRKWNIQGVYNNLSKQIYWLYYSVPYYTETDTDIFKYDSALIYDLRFGAYTKYEFYVDDSAAPYYVRAVFPIISREDKDVVIRFLAFSGGDGTETTNMAFYALNGTDYLDFNNSSGDVESYIVAGYLLPKDSVRFKQSPYVWVFSKKTETGYTDHTTYLTPINESSTLMQARWDWTDLTSAGKWGTPQQVYRHQRLYQPADATDTFQDGYPVIVTKNKVRGRGRTLQLKFYGEAGKDSWIIGWRTNMQIQDGK